MCDLPVARGRLQRAGPGAGRGGSLHASRGGAGRVRSPGGAAEQSDGRVSEAPLLAAFGHPSYPGALQLGAHVVMAGTLAARPAAAIPGRLYLATDDAGGTLYRDSGSAWEACGAGVSGGAGGVQVLDRDVTEAEALNTTTETSVYSFTVPGGTLGASGVLRVSHLGRWLQNSGAGRPGPIVRVKYGGVVVFWAQHTSNVGTNANPHPVYLELLIAAANATNAQRVDGRLSIGGVYAEPPAAAVADVATLTSGHNALAVDSTTNQTLQLTVQLSNATATHSYKAMATVVEKL